MKITISTLTFLFVFAGQVFSQKKGSFTKAITYNAQTRYLVCNVPLNYTSTTPHRLVIGLHGCGGNAIGFRNELKFLSDSLQAIVVCPAGLPGNSGYMGPPDMGIIKTAIDTTALIYNIDTAEVFLLGFSCNGFAALHDAMFKTNYKYKGVISWHAAIDTSEIDQTNFNFNTTTKTCLCTGSGDLNFHPTNVILRDTLSVHTATFLFVDVPNVAHTTNFPTFKNETMKCFRFMTHVVSSTLQATAINEDTKHEFGGLIYPNPSENKMTIDLKSNFDCTLTIVDSRGILVETLKLHPAINEFSVETLPAGLYFFKITGQSGDSVITKIVKQ
ncbi:hypothetical protein CNR22_21715 [Sphingobacteriaceae bacterium]|nr:hypothetical protein CNR22_21715 [Sphingobacteriaceae bacterium]